LGILTERVGDSFSWQFGFPVGKSPVLEVHIDGHVDHETFRDRYGPDLLAEVDKHVRVGLLVNGLSMSGFDVAVPKEHAQLLNGAGERIHSVALVTQSTVARFGVAAAAMAISKPLRAFESRAEALDWLDGHHESSRRGWRIR